jgi:hypothetical protein
MSGAYTSALLICLRGLDRINFTFSVHVGFVADKVALGQVFPRVLRLSPVNFIPPVPHYLEK